jgi:hypothetical protein
LRRPGPRNREVYARLQDDDETRLLRLEALRWVKDGTYQVAVRRQQEVPAESLGSAGVALKTQRGQVQLWQPYDTIWSGLPTADKALEQVMGFLEMRCD